jgi:hypothetical protein
MGGLPSTLGDLGQGQIVAGLCRNPQFEAGRSVVYWIQVQNRSCVKWMSRPDTVELLGAVNGYRPPTEAVKG